MVDTHSAAHRDSHRLTNGGGTHGDTATHQYSDRYCRTVVHTDADRDSGSRADVDPLGLGLAHRNQYADGYAYRDAYRDVSATVVALRHLVPEKSKRPECVNTRAVWHIEGALLPAR
jgi:hypothetical protein